MTTALKKLGGSMALFDRFKRARNKDEEIITSNVESFADTIYTELKRATSKAISSAVEEVEGKYLRTVLAQSVFPLEGIIYTPQDSDTTRLLDDFIRNHEGLDPLFRHRFFKSILQSEYKTKRGAVIVVPEDFIPTMSHSEQSFQNHSAEEKFQVSLRGQRLLFSANAILGKPLPRREFKGGAVSSVNTGLMKRSSKSDAIKLQLRWTDRNGQHSEQSTVPLQIGREPDPNCALYGFSTLTIQGTYISRRQLNIFSMLDQICAVVPYEASLTCLRNNAQKMEPGRIYLLDLATKETFQFGVAPETHEIFRHHNNTLEYPRLEITRAADHEILPPRDGTPKPKIK